MESSLDRLLKKARAFVFDLDGTIFLDDHLLPGAPELLATLDAAGVPFFFLTNNSSKSASDYAEKLQRLGLPYGENCIVSSGLATALYLQKRKPGAKLYVVGTPSLEQEFTRHGFDLGDRSPDFAVLGFDTTLTYARLRTFCDLLREGVPYIATHPDINCPTGSGFMPDIGAFMALIAASTGRDPDVIVGKPNPPIVEAVSDLTGIPLEELVMVGDRLYTDIALGRAGLMTLLVLTGETKENDLVDSPYIPDAVAVNLVEINRAMLSLR